MSGFLVGAFPVVLLLLYILISKMVRGGPAAMRFLAWGVKDSIGPAPWRVVEERGPDGKLRGWAFRFGASSVSIDFEREAIEVDLAELATMNDRRGPKPETVPPERLRETWKLWSFQPSIYNFEADLKTQTPIPAPYAVLGIFYSEEAPDEFGGLSHPVNNALTLQTRPFRNSSNGDVAAAWAPAIARLRELREERVAQLKAKRAQGWADMRAKAEASARALCESAEVTGDFSASHMDPETGEIVEFIALDRSGLGALAGAGQRWAGAMLGARAEIEAGPPRPNGAPSRRLVVQVEDEAYERQRVAKRRFVFATSMEEDDMPAWRDRVNMLGTRAAPMTGA